MSPSKKNQKRIRQYRGGPMASMSHPAQLKCNLEFAHQYRFTSTTGGSINITDATILTAMGVSARTAVLGQAIFQALKIRKIEIWAPPASQGAAVTASIYWPPTAGQAGMGREVSDTSVSVSEPAHVVSSPPRGSLAGFWQYGAGNNLVALNAPPGSIIDIWLAGVLLDGPATNAIVTATLVGATIGTIYYCCLDSSTKATGVYIPVSLTSL